MKREWNVGDDPRSRLFADIADEWEGDSRSGFKNAVPLEKTLAVVRVRKYMRRARMLVAASLVYGLGFATSQVWPVHRTSPSISEHKEQDPRETKVLSPTDALRREGDRSLAMGDVSSAFEHYRKLLTFDKEVAQLGMEDSWLLLAMKSARR